MLKPFYLNNDFQFDYHGNCAHNGIPVMDDGSYIEIDVYGEKKSFDRKHAAMYTHFRMSPILIPFENVDFVPVVSKVLRYVCGHLPVFKKPVELGYGFRIIPGFANFAINERGDILSHKTGNMLSHSLNAYGYRSVNIFDPDKETWRQVAIHILLARAFIVNEDPSRKFYVNHIDGIKLNISLRNLEWSTPRDNSTHAIAIGLADLSGLEKGRKSVGVTVHDLVTGNSYDYPSIKAASEAKKISKNWSGETKTVDGITYPRVYFKRYIVTRLGDSVPDIGMWDGATGGNLPVTGPYQALEISTGNVIECKLIKELVMATNVPYHHVTAILNSETPKKSHGYYFRTVSDGSWPTEFVELRHLTRKTFKITSKKTKEEMFFDSLGSLTNYLSTANETVYRIIKKEKEHPVYEIEETTEAL